MRIMMPVVMFLLVGQTVHAFQCNECHSKNPAMVRMHKAVQGIGCFDCHKIEEKLMGKGVPKDKAAQMQRRVTEPLCLRCHKE